ncbi:hypothetical protein D9619_001307 [Psilocybe cf. subviscida]|uniref:Uncharacterized protein n=1 Tax=Psilocybe cf. subviscida TaxID=2480587 RepID=A0A8H5BFW3_9AGAR|nr:hypothetical protein D9619_001307 [Psilocybe cf. subviscida]
MAEQPSLYGTPQPESLKMSSLHRKGLALHLPTVPAGICYGYHKGSSTVVFYLSSSDCTVLAGSTCISPTLNSVLDELKEADADSSTEAKPHPVADSTPQRSLTSLNWPLSAEESAFPDPLKVNDPKMLQLRQYEAIAMSSDVRKILAEHKNLPALLQSIDTLRGPEREDALQRALGVTAPEIDNQLRPPNLSEDIIALRQLAEAIEDAVRGGNESAPGLNFEPGFGFTET